MKKLMTGMMMIVSMNSFALTGPEKIAIGLTSGPYACQQENKLIEGLLSQDPLDVPTIQISKKIFLRCRKEVESNVAKTLPTSKDATKIYLSLDSARLVCLNEIERIETLLNEDELDVVALAAAKELYLNCKADAIKVIKANL